MSFCPKRKSEESAAEGGRPGKRERLTTDYKFRTRQEEDEDSSGAVDFVRTKVKYQDSTVGRLSGSLFQRDGEFTDGFYDACDEVSEETQECSVLFFKDTGKLQGDFAHKVSRTCNTGGYLHIESIEVDEEFRGQGLGLRLMQRCLDDIEGWTIAMIQPSPFSTNGEQNDADIFAGIGSLGRHFARLGFRQCDSNPASERAKFWYLEKCNYHGEILDKESVQDLKVVLPVLAPAVSGLSDEIREIICPRSPPVYIGPGTGAVSTMAAYNRSQLGNVLSRGGNLDESGALHFAVANQKHDFLRPLVELGANINHADHAGNTPLHVAASAFNASGVTALLQLGADKKVKNSAIAMIQPYPLCERGEAFTKAVVAMGCHFARLGFQKCDANSASERTKFWFLEACSYSGQILDKESVKDLEVVLLVSQPDVADLGGELREIITQGAEAMTHDLDTLSAAEEASFKEKVAAVLARGASLDGCGALHVAAANKRYHYLRPLIDLGANINHADHAGNTPLHVAACGFDHRGATLLLQLGADKKAKNSTGQTAAQLARDSRGVLAKTSIFRNRLGDADLTIMALK